MLSKAREFLFDQHFESILQALVGSMTVTQWVENGRQSHHTSSVPAAIESIAPVQDALHSTLAGGREFIPFIPHLAGVTP
jgi:hypothetical protein